MRVTARLTSVKSCPAGQGVSYGHEYVTPADTVLGLVPMGYADGIPRAAGNRGPLQVRGRRYTVAGRVCMDQFVLDLGAGYAGGAGDEVVVLGRGADGEPTAQDWAAAAGTINYEIVTRMSNRLPRVYLGGADRDGRRQGRVSHTADLELSVVADDGVALHVEVDEGSAAANAGRPKKAPARPTVVFSHGYTLNLCSWVLQRRALVAAGYRVVLWDQRSHGRSDVAPLETLHGRADRGRPRRRHRGRVCPDGPLVLVGHSMGGMTMMSLAGRNPELIRSRVLAAAFVATSAGGRGMTSLGFGPVLGRAIGRVGARGAHPARAPPGVARPVPPDRPRRRGGRRQPLLLRLRRQRGPRQVRRRHGLLDAPRRHGGVHAAHRRARRGRPPRRLPGHRDPRHERRGRHAHPARAQRGHRPAHPGGRARRRRARRAPHHARAPRAGRPSSCSC